jgi:hypothetical protein
MREAQRGGHRGERDSRDEAVYVSIGESRPGGWCAPCLKRQPMVPWLAAAKRSLAALRGALTRAAANMAKEPSALPARPVVRIIGVRALVMRDHTKRFELRNDSVGHIRAKLELALTRGHALAQKPDRLPRMVDAQHEGHDFQGLQTSDFDFDFDFEFSARH